ncbi:MAG: polysaccharide deacetylase family protein [Lachnospiraceae bacterium]|nr:polysaccharide deacetylase family protein [Lachnospiraceae bacterium]
MRSKRAKAMIAAISVMSLATIALIVFLITKINANKSSDPSGSIPDQTDTAVTDITPDASAGTEAPDPTGTADNTPGGTAGVDSGQVTDTPEPTSGAAAATPTPAITDDPNSPIKANATVSASVLNVRTGAGTDKAKLTVDGKEISLSRNDRVQILEAVNDWFRVMVAVSGRAVEGYCYAPYISPDKDSGFKGVSAISGAVDIESERYKDYDNILRDWWYERNSTHTIPTPGYANDISARFSDYDAYYANLNVSEGDKVIYITFDAGYENGYTTQILDTLKKHNAKACFFVTTGFIREVPDIAKRMKDEGHLVGNHTKNHPVLPNKTDEQIEDELTSVEVLFKEKTGYELDRFIRPPQGDFSERTLKIQQDMGYKTIFWSLAIPNDWDNTKQDKVDSLGRFKADHHSGCIALVHANSSANANALDSILTFLENEGYRFGTLDELK